MPSDSEAITVREAVAVFNDAKNMESAIDELLESGFDRAQLSLLAAAYAVDAKLGRHFERVQGLEDDPAAPRVAYVSRDAIAGIGAAVCCSGYEPSTPNKKNVRWKS